MNMGKLLLLTLNEQEETAIDKIRFLFSQLKTVSLSWKNNPDRFKIEAGLAQNTWQSKTTGERSVLLSGGFLLF